MKKDLFQLVLPPSSKHPKMLACAK